MKMSQWPARLVLVGAGKMGGAMASGWLEAGLATTSLTILEPNPSCELAALAAARGVELNPLVAALAPPDVLALAVKPQSLDAAAAPIARLAGARTLVMSILAGKTVADLEARFPGARAVVRAMPNTPAAIGRGVSAAFANSAVDARQRRWSENLLGAVGAFYWLDDEAAIDAVTAISGSGPAYVFALTEALASAGEKLGLPAELSMNLARGTVEGAGELMRRESSISPAILRRNVTSPGGTTAAALAVLQGPGGLDDLMARAAAAARARAAEMAG
jgi:pyrroline-5-carboxylate reductase